MSFKKFFRTLTITAGALGALGVVESYTHSSTASAANLWTEKSQSDAQKDKGGSIDVASLNRAFVDLAKNMSPAVVNIYTKTRIGGAPRMGAGGQRGGMAPDDLFKFFFGNPFGGEGGPAYQQEAQALGSGFVINNEGLIITNSHVVRMNGRNADSIMVKFSTDSSASKGHEAKILGVDEGTDVAVIKLKQVKKDIVVAPLANSDRVQVGEWVVAIGNPYGHTNSVTKGIVSALGRQLDDSGIQNRADFIQTDASINPGNSGGPLFNLYGEVIGINTAIDARAQGIGFAIPINTAKSVVKQLIEKGEVTLGWVGVSIDEINPQVARSLSLPKDFEGGVLIQDAFPGEPAARAGIKSYDVIAAVNGKPIYSGRDFMIAIANTPVGATARFKVYREGKTLDVPVTVSKRKSEKDLASRFNRGRAAPDRPVARAGRTGLMLGDLTPEIRRQLELEAGTSGAVVTKIQRGSVAAAAGLAPGDVIIEVDRKKIHNAREAEQALGGKKDNFLLKISRGSATVIVLLDVSQPDGGGGDGFDNGNNGDE